MPVKILIVENNQSIAQDLQGRLLGHGFEVVGICTSSTEAMESIKAYSPDMIIMNIRLQRGTDGIKTGRLVRSTHDLPIIYMTETAGQETLRRAKSTGPFGYIFIPFIDRQIFTTLEIALLRNQYEKEIQESQRWLTGILNGIADGVVAINDRGQIRYINQVAQTLTGCSHMEAIGKSVHEVLHLVDEKTSQSIQVWGGSNASYTMGNPSTFEALLVSKTGKNVVIEVNVTLLAEDDSGRNEMVIAFRNIQKQRETLYEIQRQAERAQTLVKSAKQLNSDLELANVLGTICKLTNHAIKASGTAVFLMDRKKEVYYNVSAISEMETLQVYNESQFTIPADIVTSIISDQNQVVVINDVQEMKDLPYLQLFQKENIHDIVIVGIFHKQELMGILASIFITVPNLLQNADLELLKGLADQAAVSITNASLFRQVRMGREHQRKLAKGIVDVQEEERRHFARELHDHLGQLLTGLQFMLESAKKQEGIAQTASLQEIQKNVGDIIGQVREMSLKLRPSMLDDMGLLPTLQWHIERFTSQTGIQVDFQSDTIKDRFPAEVEITAYRIVQEALTNVARHAHVNQVFVGMITQNNVLWIEVLDKGAGFDLSAHMTRPTSGLSGMQERASLIGGYLVIESFLNQGTQIVAALPITGKPLERRKIDRNNPGGR